MTNIETHVSQASPAPAHIASRRFSTDDLPDRDRVAFVREVWGRAKRQIDIEPLGEGPYSAAGVAWDLPGLSVVGRTSSPVKTTRTKAHLADGAEDMLVMVRSGSGTAFQLGREVPLEAGDAVLISNADVGVTAFPVASQILVLPASRQALAPVVRDVEDAFMRPVQQPGALRLLAGYVDMIEKAQLEAGDAPADVELQRTLAAHVRDLVALVVGATRDATEVARCGGGARAARLAAIRADVIANLGHTHLTARFMARRHGVCERYVFSLFEDSGVSFGAFVTEERLKRALAMLRDPACREKRISDIAFEVGFGDLSYFNRTFRRRYGETPTDIRRHGGVAADAHPAPRGLPV
jgi:AraC-like DNA-binding protein